MLAELGLTVLREIPPHMWGGIISQGLSVHGGVIRNGAGQIMAHLATPSAASSLIGLVPGANVLSSIVSNGQLMMLSRSIAQVQSSISTVLNVATAGAALSGIGLVVSISGFAYLSNRLKVAEALLKDIKNLIEANYVAQLKTAIANMKHVDDQSLSVENRRDLLLVARQNFSTLANMYGDLVAGAENTTQIRALENFYTLAFLGSSITTSELGMHDVAVKEFADHLNNWRVLVRGKIQDKLIKGDPKRLISIKPVNFRTTDVIEVLDFANETSRGIDWLDTIRADDKSWSLSMPSKLPWSENVDLDLAALSKVWVKRSDVLSSHGAHLAFLAEKKITVGQFSRELSSAANEDGGKAICIVSTTALESAHSIAA